MNLRFVWMALKKMDVKGRLEDARQIADRAGKSRIAILVDMAVCAVRYGAGPADYRLFEFCSKNHQQRSTYITRGMNNTLVKKYNHAASVDIIDNKVRFCRHFGAFIGREWLPVENLTADALAAFCRGKERLLYKPEDGSCGKGVELIHLDQWTQEALLKWVQEKGGGLLDELVIQHPDMAKINPSSVNTVRIVTLRKDGVTTPLFGFLRMGMGGKVVDNLNSNGIAAKLELTDGSIHLPAAGKDGRVHTCHPETGTPIVGFVVPHWEKVLQLAIQASAVVPQVGYVGWDIAVRETDVVLIEGNGYPGHDILQLPAYTPDHIGLKSVIEAFL